MRRFVVHSLIVAALTVGGIVLSASEAQAQMPRGTTVRPIPSIQTFAPPFAPSPLQQYALRQWAHNTAVIGRTYAQLPPWLFGYNPYPPPIYGPVYRYPVYPMPFYPTPYYPLYPSYGYGGYVNPYGGY